jgi:hypothetical protein
VVSYPFWRSEVKDPTSEQALKKPNMIAKDGSAPKEASRLAEQYSYAIGNETKMNE